MRLHGPALRPVGHRSHERRAAGRTCGRCCTRPLVRDVRFRLREIVAAARGRGSRLGPLPRLLAAYPDPDATRSRVDSRRAVRRHRCAHSSALLAAAGAFRTSTSGLRIHLGCAARVPPGNLLWDLRHGSGNIERTLGALDVTRLTEGAGAQPRRHPDQEPLLRRQRHRLRDAAMPGGLRHARPAAADRRLQAAAARRRLGHRAVPAQRLGAHAVPDAVAARASATRSSSSAGASTTRCTWASCTQPDDDGDDDGFWLDTSITGNHNTGHAFAADAATWASICEDPEGESAAARRHRARVHRRAALRHHRVPQGSSRPAGDAAPTINRQTATSRCNHDHEWSLLVCCLSLPAVLHAADADKQVGSRSSAPC